MMTEPIPRPIMDKPVVKETLAMAMGYDIATLLKPAARRRVMPPLTMQYKPGDSNAASRREIVQFKGSLTESSGCGLRMILQSFVFFLPGRVGALGGVLERVLVMSGGYGETGEDDVVRARKYWRPGGS